MNKAITTQLPSHFLQSLREAAHEEMLPTLVSLDRATRTEMRLLLRSLLVMIDRSENWKPVIVARRFYFAVESNQEARVALDKLASLGCARYAPSVGPEQITAIFVSKAGDYSFVFSNEDRERYFGEINRDAAASSQVTFQDVILATSLNDLVGHNKPAPQRPESAR